MGVVQYFGKQFYEELPTSTGPLQLGQVVWIIVPHLLPTPNVIEAVRQQTTSHETARARFTMMTDKHFTRREHKELLILNLRLAETEEVVAFKAKRRPGVVVGRNATTFPVTGGTRGRRAHHEENRCVVAPIYGVQSEEDVSGFSGIMTTRVRHLLYRQFFPAAPWTERRPRKECADACSLKEGVIRLDRLQFVMPSKPSLQQVPLKIAKEPLGLLQAWLWTYLHASQHGSWAEDLDALRDLFGEQLPEEATPSPS